MNLSKKNLSHIWMYNKHYIIIGAIVAFVAFSLLFRFVTKKESLIYVATVNIVESDKLTTFLKDDFLNEYIKNNNGNEKKDTMTLYSGLYLTTDKDSEFYDYTYTSEVKIVGALEAKQLDLVLMDKESFDAFSSNGYLCDIDEYLKKNMPEFEKEHKDDLVKNIIILEDNADEVSLDNTIPYEAKTEEATLGLKINDCRFYKDFGYKDDMYLGIIKDTTRSDVVSEYIEYLY